MPLLQEGRLYEDCMLEATWQTYQSIHVGSIDESSSSSKSVTVSRQLTKSQIFQ